MAWERLKASTMAFHELPKKTVMFFPSENSICDFPNITLRKVKEKLIQSALMCVTASFFKKNEELKNTITG
jgi:pimeloyl-CoA synthetase